MNIKLLFIPLLLFSSELYAETIHLGILNTSGNEAENVLYAETASVLKDKLKPRNVEVSTYDLPGLEKAIAAGKLDFFISNPVLCFQQTETRYHCPCLSKQSIFCAP